MGLTPRGRTAPTEEDPEMLKSTVSALALILGVLSGYGRGPARLRRLDDHRGRCYSGSYHGLYRDHRHPVRQHRDAGLH